ncbi:hypothetical protein [Hydrogenophaga sp. PAMC20947]|uniref:Pepco domain-containing protein n=1 Tax=Hydrogenophaga sp. PAMC20947 TaxID=2565558 RepID=UPI001444C9CB|nr:hypothetical protein [Hydrogenophaga sp. PAMC20947]
MKKKSASKMSDDLGSGIRIAVARHYGSNPAEYERRGVLDSVSSRVNDVAMVTSGKLAENLKSFSEQFGSALAAVGEGAGAYEIDEIKVIVELGVEGEVTLLGSGVSTSGKAGVEMTFRRKVEK